jgi:hypothetical protein
MKPCQLKNLMLQFAQQLGKLYSIAAVDGTVRTEEITN